MMPDPSGVLVVYLADHDEIGGAGVSVSTRTPNERGGPWIRVTLLPAQSTDGGITDRHIEALVQLDCYAGEDHNDSEAASLLARTVCEAIRVMNQATHDDAVVTGAMSSFQDLPDDSLGEPPLERYIVTSTIWMRSA